jgi:hypothetical protein
MKLELWIYRLMLQAYPKDFRLDFGHEMLQVFKLELKHAKLERRTLMFWVSALADCVFGATREQFFRRGESMNWLRKIAIFSSLLIVFQSLNILLMGVFHFQNLFLPSLIIPIGKYLPILSFLAMSLTFIGVFLSLSEEKNKLEQFGTILLTMIFLTRFLEIFNILILKFNGKDLLISFTYVISISLVVFARLKISNGKLDFSKIPMIAKFLVAYFLLEFIFPYLIIFLTPNDQSYQNLSYFFSLASFFAYLALAFGIWRSIPTQSNTSNLISSL